MQSTFRLQNISTERFAQTGCILYTIQMSYQLILAVSRDYKARGVLSYRGCVYKSPESCLLCVENAMFVGWMIVVPVSQPRCNSFSHPGQGCCGVCCSGSVAASNSRAELQTSQSEFIAGGRMCACAIVVRRRCFSYRLVSRCPASVVINVPTSY
jgi:hypothetical protein